ncbi:MAG: hypothetical protein HYY17_15995 [Planctomycetes bacterium]|nr:hypothetical protein [Planctomycetota bacterium]
MGDLGFDEILAIAIVAVLCFGKDLPMVARKVGRVVGKVRRYLMDIKEDVRRQLPMDDFDVARDAAKDAVDVKDPIDEALYHPTSEPPSALAKSDPPPAAEVKPPETGGATAPPSPPA